MQEDGRGGVLGFARSGCDWFADGIDGQILLPASFVLYLEQSSIWLRCYCG